jgi:hypothetical protein
MNNNEHGAPMAIPVERGTQKSGHMHRAAATTPAAPVSITPSKTGKWKKVGLALVGIVVCVALVVALSRQDKRNGPAFNPRHGGQPLEDKDDPDPQIRLALHAHLSVLVAPLAGPRGT